MFIEILAGIRENVTENKYIDIKKITISLPIETKHINNDSVKESRQFHWNQTLIIEKKERSCPLKREYFNI